MTGTIIDRAVAEWGRGDFYEAHETLEDLVDAVEDDDTDWAIALALCHVAAALHKHVNDVGARAVPGKLQSALTELDRAPAVWFVLDVEALRRGVRGMLTALQDGGSFELPVLGRRA